MISRKWKGRTILVEALAKGFRYENQPYSSLSAFAVAVTGTHYYIDNIVTKHNNSGMRHAEVHLKESEEVRLNAFRRKGTHLAREVNRAHVLMALDSGVPDDTICQVLGLGRTALWRTRSSYLEGGLEYALHDEARSGQPRKYQTDQAAEVIALACGAPPQGRKKWTVRLLTAAAGERPGWPA